MTALDGIRVVDLTRVLSGPFCSMMLGDMGAEVIKVEPPAGDPVRKQGTLTDGFSHYFAAFNRNKKSVVLDLYSEAGKQALARLIEGADILIENFRPGVLAKMGFDQPRLDALNPRLVVCSINGYGSEGPYVDRPAFDFIAQAMSGFMSVNGGPEDPPLRSGQPITDLVAGLYGAFGAVSALHAAQRTGKGQHVEAAMVNGSLSMMAYLASEFFATGKLPPRTGNDHPLVAPYGLFKAADGQVAVAPSTPIVLRRFMRAIGREELLDDPRFDTNEKRFAARKEINALVDEAMQSHSQEDWIARLNEAGVPCGRVQTLREVFDDPQIKAQEMMIEVDHPGHGAIKMLGFPVKLSGTPCAARLPSPELGEHTREVLEGLGYSAAEIEALTQKSQAA